MGLIEATVTNGVYFYIPSFHSLLVSPKSDSSTSTICPIVPLTINDPSQSMADKNTNPFTSPPSLFDTNPFLPHTSRIHSFRSFILLFL